MHAFHGDLGVVALVGGWVLNAYALVCMYTPACQFVHIDSVPYLHHQPLPLNLTVIYSPLSSLYSLSAGQSPLLPQITTSSTWFSLQCLVLHDQFQVHSLI